MELLQPIGEWLIWMTFAPSLPKEGNNSSCWQVSSASQPEYGKLKFPWRPAFSPEGPLLPEVSLDLINPPHSLSNQWLNQMSINQKPDWSCFHLALRCYVSPPSHGERYVYFFVVFQALHATIIWVKVCSLSWFCSSQGPMTNKSLETWSVLMVHFQLA